MLGLRFQWLGTQLGWVQRSELKFNQHKIGLGLKVLWGDQTSHKATYITTNYNLNNQRMFDVANGLGRVMCGINDLSPDQHPTRF